MIAAAFLLRLILVCVWCRVTGDNKKPLSAVTTGKLNPGIAFYVWGEASELGICKLANPGEILVQARNCRGDCGNHRSALQDPVKRCYVSVLRGTLLQF